MFPITRGQLLLGGMVITLCTKAALAVPDLTGPEDIPPDQLAALTRPGETLIASAKEEPKEEEETDIPPPLIEGLTDSLMQCETPEEVLASLNQERDLLADQIKAHDIRQSELELAREKLAIEKSALLELQGSIEALLKRVEAAQTEDLDRLISFYSNMKPAEAAGIMDDMDIEVTLLVLAAMKPRAAAPILAKMSPVRARAVSKIILERSQLPGDQDLNGIRLR